MLTWPFVLGLVLGLRHATDADHVVAIATVLDNDGGIRKAFETAVVWGLGHTLTFLGVGLGIVVLGCRIPPSFETVAEGGVGTMLILFGMMSLVQQHLPAHRNNRNVSRRRWRPFGIGVVHGMAGSAGIALLALTTIPTMTGAVTYLFLFGVGTVAGMVILTVALWIPLGWSMRKNQWVQQSIIRLAGLASVALGLVLVVRVWT